MSIKLFLKDGLRYDGLKDVRVLEYQCGYCANKVASDKGVRIVASNSAFVGAIYICPNCGGPTYYCNHVSREQSPPPALGSPIRRLPPDIEALYEEARSCTSQGCYTSCVMICRKLLMHIAHELGASDDKSFVEYINFLSDDGHITKKNAQWVSIIRTKGNEANHEIKIFDVTEAAQVLEFTSMLLKTNYEYIPEKDSRDSTKE